jgi:hypothetical protein
MRGAKGSIWAASVGLVIVALIIMPGCSLFVKKEQAVTIRATDPNADIYVDGANMGKGTLSLTLDRTRSHTVTAKTADGKAGAAAINKKVSGTGVLDIVGGIFFLVPFLGLLGPGFWELDPDSVTVYLQ